MERHVAIGSQDWSAKGASTHLISDNNKVTLKSTYQTWLNTATAGTSKSVINITPWWDGEEHNLLITYYLETTALIPSPRYGQLAASLDAPLA